MRKYFFYILFSILFTIPTISHAQGFNRFRRVLKKEFKLLPFKIPDLNYSPGTVLLIYKKSEQLYAPQNIAFPTIQLAPKSIIGNVKTEKIKNISFKANTESNIVPEEVMAIAKIGLDSKSTLNLDINNLEVHQLLDQIELTASVYDLDLGNTRERILFEKLLLDECIVVSKTLFFDGLTFSFKRDSKITSDIKTEIKKAATKAGVDLKITNDYKFTIKSNNGLHYAFDTYRKNSANLKQLYNEKLRELNLKKKINANKSIIASTSGNLNKVNMISRQMNSLESAKIKYQEEIKNLDTESLNKEDIENYIKDYNSQVSLIESQIENLNIEKIRLSNEYEQINILKEQNLEYEMEINQIKSNKYELFSSESNGIALLELLYEYEPLINEEE